MALRAGPLSLRLRGTRLLPVHAGAHEVWHGVAYLYHGSGALRICARPKLAWAKAWPAVT